MAETMIMAGLPCIELDLTADEAIVAMTHRLGIFWNPLDNVTK